MRHRYVNCWTCGGYGTIGRFLNRNIHVTLECPTCRGLGFKELRRYTRK